MNFNLIPALPEIFLTLMVIVLLLTDVFLKSNKQVIIKILTLFIIFFALVLQVISFGLSPNSTTFNNMFVLDKLAQGTKIITYLISLVIVLYIERYIEDKKISKPEYYAIFLFALIGMQIMISANNMIVLYVGLELMSLALYSLVAINRDDVRSTEAAMKFFILGSLASGLLLFGISLIYGSTGGELQLQRIFESIYKNNIISLSLLILGLVFIIAGIAFKLGLVPFHMWLPDVYEGSSLATTLIISSVTKIASVIFIFRILLTGLLVLNIYWTTMLEVLAVLSLFIGNIVAISQTNIKRMLGYSAISHMGFIALGIMTLTSISISATIFYTIVYVLTNLLVFGVLIFLSHSHYECQAIDDLRGLNKSHPVYAGIILLTMFSLAGIPPLAGFYAKFNIILGLVNTNHIYLAVYAVLMSLIGTFYYLRIVKVMYFDDVNIDLQVAKVDLMTKITLIINALLIVLIGLNPSSIMSFCSKIIT
jgi:NADH-quinone oxidoreductase subunit N